jgi:protocadherin-15
LKSKDPLVTVTLDDFSTSFAITPTGITRYLRLLKPVDREKQMTYTFTVRLIPTTSTYITK